MSRIRRRAFIKASGGVAGVAGLAGCLGDLGGGDSGPITIGAIQPFSGNFAPWGNAHQAGLEFAIDEINEDGGVMGRELNQVNADTASDPGEADSIFRRFVEQEDAVAVTGPVSSDVGIRTAQTAQDLQVPNVLHMAGSNDVITPDTNFAFRLGILPATTGMQAQSGLVEDAGYAASEVGAIIADYGWGRSVEESINAEFPFDIQIEVAPVGAGDFKSVIRNLPQDIKMLVATGHPPGQITITNQLYELGYDPEVITGAGFPPNVMAGALGENAFKAFTHIHNSDAYSSAFAEVAQRFGEANDSQFTTHTAYGYVAGKMLAAAIEDAGEADGVAIRESLVNIEYDTLFANPIKYSDNGELEDCIQIFSKLRSGGPEFYPSGSFHLEEQFRTDPLPALPPEG